MRLAYYINIASVVSESDVCGDHSWHLEYSYRNKICLTKYCSLSVFLLPIRRISWNSLRHFCQVANTCSRRKYFRSSSTNILIYKDLMRISWNWHKRIWKFDNSQLRECLNQSELGACFKLWTCFGSLCIFLVLIIITLWYFA